MISYFLCDSWYTSAGIMKSFLEKGFYTIGALKTNRILYPMGIRQKASELALRIRKSDPNVSLVTVDKRRFYVYRYEGNLNKISNAVVLLSYPEECFGNPKALRYLFPLTCPCLRRRFLIRMPNAGLLNCSSGRVNRNWDWTNIRSVPARESKGTG